MLAVGGIIAALTCVAYHNSLSAPFVFDDLEAIVENPSIRDLSDIAAVFSPPLSSTGAVGRPIVNLSFAIDYAVSGTNVFGYHLTNLLIHVGAALVLFGVIRRALLLLGETNHRLRVSALTIAGFGSLLWAIHPLLTESVTSVVQRSESLMGLFFLLTFYSFIRSRAAGTPNHWPIAAVVFCFLGVASKEVMAVCPLLLLLFDRTFVAKTFVGAWRSGRSLYAGLFSSWALLLYLVIGTHGRNQTVGFGYGIPWWEYALTQCYGVANYLYLAFWPRRLVFDYGTVTVTDPMRVVPGAILLAVLLGATLRALLRRQAAGFLGAWFFVILAPSSSVLPLTTQTLAEHRMYLPLIPVVLSVVLVLSQLGRPASILATLLVPPLIAGTVNRNADYGTALRLWKDTVEKMPENARARNDLANALDAAGKPEEALTEYRRSLSLNPNSAVTHYNMGETLAALGRTAEAEAAYEAALQRNPQYAKAHNNLGSLLVERGRVSAAVAHFEAAAALAPRDVLFLTNAGNGLMAAGRWSEARRYFERVLEIDPDSIDAMNSLGTTLVKGGDVEAAVTRYRESIARHPEAASLRYNLGKALTQAGDLEGAVAAYREALRLQPDYPEAQYNIGNVRLAQRRYAEAVRAYQAAIASKPDYVAAINNLGGAYKRMGQLDQARTQYERVLRLQPHHAKAQRSLAELQERR